MLTQLALAVITAIAAAGVLPAVARAADIPTAEIGGRGGQPFADRCDFGDVLVGFEFSAGKAVDMVRALCREVSPALQLVGDVDRLNSFGGSGGNGTRERCSGQSAVTALNVSVDKFGVVHQFYAVCSAIDGSGGSRSLDIDGEGGEASYSDVAQCERGFAVGIAGGYGALIDRIGLICEDIVATLRPAPASEPPPAPAKKVIPPMQIDNKAGTGGANKGSAGGGGNTAKTDTTIYDQPGGSDRAYLSAGEAVTIKNCDDAGWCEISQPERGYVWGEDLNR